METESSLRERLIDAGVDLVLAEGSASLGLREIARRAGVSHGAPRRYFPTHHSLLSEIARRGFEDLGARFAGAVTGTGSARAQLEAVARVYISYALERRGMFELMFRHELLDSDQHASGERRLRESTVPLFERIVALVARCRSEQDTARRTGGPGETAPPPAVTAAALWSNLHGMAQLWAWGSLQLALDTSPPGGAPRGDRLDDLVAAVLNAHLGQAHS
ncbi:MULTISPECIES: TetR/AcrR family transcriptional regulator [unclassified Streptomyces]|uniref:TetR/AcrR family transcriptional regulator n=1 Tax=unclassified Streptomyces TaxID=2593676 RepID=UPI001BE803CE|nr:MULTISPECIES: TetR/AcrR family transcriptional regulator [unclassified Streptomyces]MBT2408494.1 TetR/AcrR family transcriptional regulator [Streptomyces sp. ISL-21]MBT2459663.1 TetR/AcrR family transcriptional regulator [Streptomyces sp. ISL-86]MBT2611931.1 TetR/AcrR family transcriptional regulator [Streptomyces sp. ISL-87]